MREMIVKGIRIDDTFAEAFNMRATAVIITADSARWARQAAVTMTGFGTSVIGCGCEAGIDGELSPRETPDRRPGIRVLLFAVSTSELQRQLQNRVAQCVLTTPGSACYAGLEGEEALKLGNALRFFGDGWQISKRFAGKHYWRVPVMDGEFVLEESYGVVKGVGGGNFFMMAGSLSAALAAARAAVAAMRTVPGAIMPFPGGVVRSGSKVSSRYKGQHVSSNTPYCPTLRAEEGSALREGENAVLEIVVDGLDEATVAEAMRVGIAAACLPGVTRISAGNYGGSLGQFHFALRGLMSA